MASKLRSKFKKALGQKEISTVKSESSGDSVFSATDSFSFVNNSRGSGATHLTQVGLLPKELPAPTAREAVTSTSIPAPATSNPPPTAQSTPCNSLTLLPQRSENARRSPENRTCTKYMYEGIGAQYAEKTPHQDESSCESKASPRNLQERLWNEAYDKLKENDPKMINAYETILSIKLNRTESASAVFKPGGNEIGQTRETRWEQMQQLVQQGLERTERAAAIKQGINDTLRAVEAIKGMVDKAVKAAPQAALAWVGVCIGLEIFGNPVNQESANREGIQYVISRMEWYSNFVCLLLDENRVDKSALGLRDELEDQILELYQKILLFQIKSVGKYYRNMFNDILRSLFKLDDWDGQLAEIKAAEAAISRDSEQYNTEQTKSYLQNLALAAQSREAKLQDIHSAIHDLTTQQERRHEYDKDKKCLQHLYETDPFHDKQRIQDTKGGLLRDSYCWVLDNADFLRFRTDPQSQVLWIKGDPGKGKTMLLCGIIDELEKETPTNQLAYFFCQATETRLSNATAVLRSLIYKLTSQYPPLISHIREQYDAKGDKLLLSNAWQVLSEILRDILSNPILDRAVIVIDALDECGTDRQLLLDFITTSPTCTKWVVSSRNSYEIESILNKMKQKVRLSLELNEKSISDAVNTYVRHSVLQLANDKGYDAETRLSIERHLIANANSTFLWVALVCQELWKAESWDALDVINDVPSDLAGLYQQMIQQIQCLGRQNPERCRSILSTVATAYRPLRLEELGLLSDLPPNIQRSSANISKISSMCGSFLTIKDNVVYVIHQSAMDFLSSNEYLFSSDNMKGDQHRTIFLRSLQALSRGLRRDIYSLNAPGLLVDQISPPDPDPLASIRYSCIYWIDHLRDSYMHPAETTRDDMDLRNDGAVHDFFKKKYIYWPEALSLLGSLSTAGLTILKLEALIEGYTEAEKLKEFLGDAHRFIRYHREAIEVAPLQVYASALVFSPTRSLVRMQFEKEEPDWMTVKPRMEPNWDACLQTLEGDTSRIFKSADISADGKRVVSLSPGGVVRIWDAATGAYMHPFDGYGGGSILSIAMSADGKRVVWGSGDGKIEIRDAVTGVRTRESLESPCGEVWSVAISANAQHIAWGSNDRVVRVWNDATGSLRMLESQSSDPVMSIAISADGQLVGFMSQDGTVNIWDGDKCVRTFEGRSNSDEVTISADGQRVAFISKDNKMTIGHVATGLETRMKDSPVSVAISGNGRRAVSGSSDGTVKTWDTTTGACVHTLEGHNDSAFAVAISADGKQAVSASYDGTVKVWDATRSRAKQMLVGHEDTIRLVEISADGKRAISASDDCTVKIWDTATGACVQTLVGHGDGVVPATISTDGQRVVSGSDDATVRIWDAATGVCVQTLEGHARWVMSVAVSSDGRRIVSGSRDRTVKIWNTATGMCVQTLEGHNRWVTSVAISTDGRRVVSGSGDKTVKIWDTATGACLQTLEKAYNIYSPAICISADLQQVASSFGRLDMDEVRIWDVATGACIYTLRVASRISRLSFDPTVRSRLSTNIGVLDLGQPSVETAHSQGFAQNLSDFGNVGIRLDWSWIVKDGKGLLWLPPEHRGFSSDVVGSTVILSRSSGRVLLMRFL